MSTADKLTAIAENVPKVFASGELSVWNDVTQNGNRTIYNGTFMDWGIEEINPPVAIVPKSSYISLMFAFNTNLKKVYCRNIDLSQRTVNYDMNTNSTYGNDRLFRDCTALEEVEDIKMPAGYYSQTFRGCTNLHTIAVLRFNSTTLIANAFDNCNSLKNITVEGEIGVSINLNWSPLSVESMKSVITHLKNYAGTSKQDTCTVKFNSNCWASLESDSTAPHGGTWKDYVQYQLGWLV